MQNPLLVGVAKIPLFILVQLLSDIASNAAELQMRCYGLQGSEFLYAAQISIEEHVRVLIDCPHGPVVNHAFGPASHLFVVWPLLERGTETTIRLAKVTLERVRSSIEDEAADSHQRISHDIALLDRILHDQQTLEKCARGDLEAMRSLSCSHFPARVCGSGLLEKYDDLLKETW
ncbi:hypothetical protein M409DRAFT_21786 [Zasmidium cellare ATCC 36951]|uniref:Uncharacterized protein n=1 Tax=Zasmidium cellare ATCC 36951 TaxID=1080233 RepID=A0A6A6CR94_ZASCE|nr:uncharacterized protein M409DRAFT_21786 [Zasmidium cellare ATCC 36951]KAF2168352.1 hypothetical protein M409DRAFT_21786 [Zasmidium cellare ATCC 36951]